MIALGLRDSANLVRKHQRLREVLERCSAAPNVLFR
jgi:hypothetical protein